VTRWEAHGKLGDQVEARSVVEQRDVVEDQGDRLGQRRDGAGQPRHDCGRDVGTR
jgi:hypothetical protein